MEMFVSIRGEETDNRHGGKSSVIMGSDIEI